MTTVHYDELRELHCYTGVLVRTAFNNIVFHAIYSSKEYTMWYVNFVQTLQGIVSSWMENVRENSEAKRKLETRLIWL